MHIGSYEYANEADDDDHDDVPKPAQSLGTPVPRQKPLKKEECRVAAIKTNTNKAV